MEPGTEEYARRYTDWTERGVEAYESTRDHLMTLFGGAKGGSKTVTGVRILQTDISNYSGGVFVVMRKNYTVLHSTTKVSFERFFPPELVLRKTTDIWYCVNDNQIWWWAADRSTDPDYEKTRGLEATALFPDEASQLDEGFYEIAPSLLRRPAYHLDTGEPLPPYIYLTTNPVPGKNYLKRHFIDPRTRKRDSRHSFIQSLPDDNPLLPDGYIDTAFGNMSEPMLQMLRFGKWDVEESEFKVVPSTEWRAVCVEDIEDRTIVGAGIDIGLGRPDRTVVYAHNRQGQVWRYAAFSEYDTMKQVEQLSPVCEAVQVAGGVVHIDAGSVGKGVADRLDELYWNVIRAELFGMSPVEEYDQGQRSYENRRAQLYYWARQDVMRQEMEIVTTEELDEELDNTFYVETEGKIKIEPKANIKERIGRSPDDGDAFVLCNAARRAQRSASLTLPSATRTERRSRRSSLTDNFR